MAFEYFNEAELRALPQMSDTVVYTTARCDAAAAYVVGVIEGCTKTSFIARTVTDERHDGGTYGVLLEKPYVLSVTSATESGTAVADTLRVRHGVLRRYAGATATTPRYWAAGFDNITVTYQAGYTAAAPADLKEAALKATRAHLLATNSNATIDDRRTSMNTEMGTINFVIAGEDRPFGYPEIDAVVMRYKRQLNTVVYP